MISLRSGLRDTVARMSRQDHVALMLSGGRDSITTGIACQEAGKTVHAYTYELDGYRSTEREKVKSIARHFGWKLSVVTVPTNCLSDDFKRLAIGLGCRKKVHFEVSYPVQYLMRVIEEAEIWTGWNADDHLGNTREYVFHQARLKRDHVPSSARKADFDAYLSSTSRTRTIPSGRQSPLPTGLANGFWMLTRILNGEPSLGNSITISCHRRASRSSAKRLRTCLMVSLKSG